MLTISPMFPVPKLDRLMARYAALLPRVSGGGLFWHPARPAVGLDAWVERGAFVLVVGKLELILDRP